MAREPAAQHRISVASSSDGTHLAAAVNNGQIAISINVRRDLVTNYRLVPGLVFRCGVGPTVCRAAAVVDVGNIYTSVNSGVTWTPRATSLGSLAWYSIASSADGTMLAAVVNNGQIYTSANSGQTWTVSSNSPTAAWISIASSSDGNELVAAVNNGNIYTSGDAGANWTQRASSLAWYSVGISGGGTCMVAAINNGVIYNSVDSGQTWTSRATSQPWNAVCVSTDGTRAAAGINGGQIYTSTSATTVGTGGYLAGAQYSNIELQSIGGGQWMPLSFAGTFTAN